VRGGRWTADIFVKLLRMEVKKGEDCTVKCTIGLYTRTRYVGV